MSSEPRDRDHIPMNPDEYVSQILDDGVDIELDEDADSTRIGDLLALHGVLSLLGPAEADRIEHRIQSALDRVGALESPAVIGRVGMDSRSSSSSRAAVTAAVIGLAALLLVAIFVPPIFSNNAWATLDAIESRFDSGRDRQYEIIVRKADGRSHRRMELSIGGPGKHVLQVHGDSRNEHRRHGCSGFDGERYWHLSTEGSVVYDDKPARMIPMLGISSSLSHDQLMLRPILRRLRRGYDIEFVAQPEGESNIIRIRAILRDDIDEASRAPSQVVLTADKETKEILDMDVSWGNGDDQGTMTREINFKLKSDQAHPDDWFRPDTHKQDRRRHRPGGPRT